MYIGIMARTWPWFQYTTSTRWSTGLEDWGQFSYIYIGYVNRSRVCWLCRSCLVGIFAFAWYLFDMLLLFLCDLFCWGERLYWRERARCVLSIQGWMAIDRLLLLFMLLLGWLINVFVELMFGLPMLFCAPGVGRSICVAVFRTSRAKHAHVKYNPR